MSSTQKNYFWIELFKKILKILFKNAGGSQRNSHHQHVVPHEEGWAIKGEGNEKYTGIFDTQKRAIKRASEIAENYKADVIIHGKDGAIRDRISYK